MGDVAAIFPEGIERLDDLPYPMHDAITAALGFLRFDELPADERPPKKIWFDSDAMKTWWGMVERQRERKHSGDKATPDMGPEQTNDAMKDLIVGG